MALKNGSQSGIMYIRLNKKSRNISCVLLFYNILDRGRDVERRGLLFNRSRSNLSWCWVVTFGKAEVIPILDPVISQIPVVPRELDNVVRALEVSMIFV